MKLEIRIPMPNPMATQRLLCIPHAGAGISSFRLWQTVLPSSTELVALQLPGREDRLSIPPYTEWSEFIRDAVTAVEPLLTLPLTIYGHSLGALIALEIGRSITNAGVQTIHRVICAGRPWPGTTALDSLDFNALRDDEIVDTLRTLYGEAQSTLANPAIRSLTLPIIRADFTLLNSYQWTGIPKLNCGLSVFAGKDDPITNQSDLSHWREETTGKFDIQLFDGAHLFHIQNEKTTQKIISTLFYNNSSTDA